MTYKLWLFIPKCLTALFKLSNTQWLGPLIMSWERDGDKGPATGYVKKIIMHFYNKSLHAE